jgi:pyridinium-3,5-biscarboxylic acid mononucleotide sulfurtransferase
MDVACLGANGMRAAPVLRRMLPSTSPAAGVPWPERRLVAAIAEGGPALVALSGGVDSGLVAALAHEALGRQALAVTVQSRSLAARELTRAREVATAIGLEHRTVFAEPLERAEYRRNEADRCYHCRSVETGALRALGRAEGFAQYLDGIHQDDLRDDRPGLRAMDEAGFRHPLLEAGWGKARVRSVARARGLPNWDQPSDACLASRVARGEPVSAELLGRIERAEAIVLARGFRRVRVRVRGGAARLEVGPEELARLEPGPLVEELLEAIRAIGFDPVSVDPLGYGAARSPLPVIP